MGMYGGVSFAMIVLFFGEMAHFPISKHVPFSKSITGSQATLTCMTPRSLLAIAGDETTALVIQQSVALHFSKWMVKYGDQED